MINTFKHGDSTKLTAHFAVNEFQCKCGKGHDFQLDCELVENLEQFFTVVPKLMFLLEAPTAKATTWRFSALSVIYSLEVLCA